MENLMHNISGTKSLEELKNELEKVLLPEFSMTAEEAYFKVIIMQIKDKLKEL